MKNQGLESDGSVPKLWGGAMPSMVDASRSTTLRRDATRGLCGYLCVCMFVYVVCSAMGNRSMCYGLLSVCLPTLLSTWFR